MSYKEHALKEFKIAGWLDDEGNYCDEVQEEMCDCVLQLLATLSEQGHSGSSIGYCLETFTTLAKFDLLTPLTGDDSEWNDVSLVTTDGGVATVYQNNRISHVFKQSDRSNGQPYDIDAVVFWEWFKTDDGRWIKTHFTSGKSQRPITFPYRPKKQYKFSWSVVSMVSATHYYFDKLVDHIKSIDAILRFQKYTP